MFFVFKVSAAEAAVYFPWGTLVLGISWYSNDQRRVQLVT